MSLANGSPLAAERTTSQETRSKIVAALATVAAR